MKPNIFEIATKELSQDAFITWLLKWADDSCKNLDEDLHQCGKEFVSALIKKQNPNFSEFINKVEAGRQWENIDVWAEVNDKYFIIIEDKINSSEHSDQLKRYKERNMLDREIINALLEIKAVELRVDKENWFTWASGIKSPIYCDNRLTMSYPKIRKQIAEGFVKKIKELYPNVDYIVGTATAGIPHAAWISDIMDLPMLYVRGSAKDHGKTNQIEGKFEKGKKVVVIEDLISTGKSSVLAAQALQEAGLEVLGVVAIFSYNLNKAKEKFDEAKIPFSTLTNYDVLLELAKETRLIGDKETQVLIDWRNNL